MVQINIMVRINHFKLLQSQAVSLKAGGRPRPPHQALYLARRVVVVGCPEDQARPQRRVEGRPEAAREPSVAIADQGVRQADVPEHRAQEVSGRPLGGGRFRSGDQPVPAG
eukprot:CAMPEP_0113698542 /NCGR_PEP_ID=MMETSP0038_2-20120614/22771_1 /TAXON_ID=2898 /ORGANISM="Cryptomonas paramecium" /LENGTH=110 /DNA_ID=CAMNT_0000621723 /DNA_START=26 /DNA_END=356 /DNA_ORIENTATION=+ /assembly_acc=CAM_ASM_000170